MWGYFGICDAEPYLAAGWSASTILNLWGQENSTMTIQSTIYISYNMGNPTICFSTIFQHWLNERVKKRVFFFSLFLMRGWSFCISTLGHLLLEGSPGSLHSAAWADHRVGSAGTLSRELVSSLSPEDTCRLMSLQTLTLCLLLSSCCVLFKSFLWNSFWKLLLTMPVHWCFSFPPVTLRNGASPFYT